jgi:hypothetical protein
MLEESVAEKDRLVGTRVCAPTESRGYAIYAQACIHLVDDNFAALGNLCLQGRRLVEGNRRVISGRRCNGRDGEVLSIDNYRLSVPLPASINLVEWDGLGLTYKSRAP